MNSDRAVLDINAYAKSSIQAIPEYRIGDTTYIYSDEAVRFTVGSRKCSPVLAKVFINGALFAQVIVSGYKNIALDAVKIADGSVIKASFSHLYRGGTEQIAEHSQRPHLPKWDNMKVGEDLGSLSVTMDPVQYTAGRLVRMAKRAPTFTMGSILSSFG